MKKKIIDIIVDVLLIMIVFSVIDLVSLKLFHSQNFWLEFGIYISFYAIVFGSKKGIVILRNRLVAKKKEMKETWTAQ